MGKLLKLGFDASKNLIEEIPAMTYPDGTLPEWQESDGNLVNEAKPINPPKKKKQESSHFVGTKPDLPRPPFRKSDVNIDPGTLMAGFSPHINYTEPEPATNFASKDATKPELPTPPFRQSDVTIDPGTLVASMTPEIEKKQGLPGPDDTRSLNYWLADFDLRRERGLYHPKILPMANIRQKITDTGFKIPTRGSMITGGQSKRKDPHEASAKRYDKRIKMYIRNAAAGRV